MLGAHQLLGAGVPPSNSSSPAPSSCSPGPRGCPKTGGGGRRWLFTIPAARETTLLLLPAPQRVKPPDRLTAAFLCAGLVERLWYRYYEAEVAPQPLSRPRSWPGVCLSSHFQTPRPLFLLTAARRWSRTGGGDLLGPVGPKPNQAATHRHRPVFELLNRPLTGS